VSGLYGSEDVAIAIILAARATESSVRDIVHDIMRRDGKLPKEA
jgi:hypothetical protein